MFEQKRKRSKTAEFEAYGQLEARNLLATLGCSTCGCDATDIVPLTELHSTLDVADSDATAQAAFSGRRFVQAPTTEQVGELESSFSVDASNSFFDRIDRYEFEVTEDGELSLDLEFDRNTFSRIAVYDQSRNRVAVASIRGDSQTSLTTELEAGNYVAIVFGGFGRYQLNADFTPENDTPDTTTEPDNTDGDIDSPSNDDSTPDADETTPATTSPSELPDAEYYGSRLDWNLNSVNAPEAWQAGHTGEGVVVAVIDTGVNINHSDLDDNVWVNSGEIAGDGIDNDGNGYVDDLYGWNFVSNNANVADDNGHGTHVAGTIAAEQNEFGATGVAPDSTILPIKVLNQNGSGFVNSIAAGIRYAVDNGADIVNLSLGGGFSSAIASAISYAASNDVFVVAASGNESSSTPSNPATFSSRYENVLSVGAYASNGQIAGFSNGVGNSGAVQVDAPGVSVYSTAAGGGYTFLSGTSMATPHVAGVAALTLSANSNLTAASLRNIIVQTSDRTAGGSDANGVVNASLAIPLALNSSAADVVTASTASTATSFGGLRTFRFVGLSAIQSLPDFSSQDESSSELSDEIVSHRRIQLPADNGVLELSGESNAEHAASSDQTFADFEAWSLA